MYELGCSVAFFIWIGSLVWLFACLHSQLERNLNKVGSRQSWLNLSPKPLENNYRQRGAFRKVGKFLVLILFGLLGVLLSWLYVIWYMGSLVYSFFKDAGAPQAIREFRWRLRNLDLSFDEIVQGMVIAGGNKTTAEQLGQQIYEEMADRGNA